MRRMQAVPAIRHCFRMDRHDGVLNSLTFGVARHGVLDNKVMRILVPFRCKIPGQKQKPKQGRVSWWNKKKRTRTLGELSTKDRRVLLCLSPSRQAQIRVVYTHE